MSVDIKADLSPQQEAFIVECGDCENRSFHALMQRYDPSSFENAIALARKDGWRPFGEYAGMYRPCESHNRLDGSKN